MSDHLLMERFGCQWSVRRAGKGLIVLALVSLFGCDSGPDADLIAYVKQVKEGRQGKVEDLPTLTPLERVSYAVADLRDPFMPVVARAPLPEEGGHPDLQRARGPLEAYPLDTLRMVGTLTRQEQIWALVQSADGRLHRIEKGSYLGQHHGRVMHISSKAIEIREMIADGVGGWVERPALLSLEE